MIELQHPEFLFEKQKIYRFPKFVEKKKSNVPENEVKMLVVYSQSMKSMSAAHQLLLDNLVKACKLSQQQAKYVNATCELDLLSEWERRYPNALVLLLGDISFDTKFQQVQINELKPISKNSLLKSFPIEQLNMSKEAKSELWRLLQIHFKLK